MGVLNIIFFLLQCKIYLVWFGSTSLTECKMCQKHCVWGFLCYKRRCGLLDKPCLWVGEGTASYRETIGRWKVSKQYFLQYQIMLRHCKIEN